MSNLIDFQETEAQVAFRINREQSLWANAELKKRVEAIKRQSDLFWRHFDVITPDALLAQRGSGALKWLLAARAERAHLDALAQLQGKTLIDLISPDYFNPPFDVAPRAFILGVDEQGQYTGYVTLADPPEGYDAWGRSTTPATS